MAVDEHKDHLSGFRVIPTNSPFHRNHLYLPKQKGKTHRGQTPMLAALVSQFKGCAALLYNVTGIIPSFFFMSCFCLDF